MTTSVHTVQSPICFLKCNYMVIFTVKCSLEALSKQPDSQTREEWLSHSQSPGLFELPPGGNVGGAPVIVKARHCVAASLPQLKWPGR